MKDEGGNVLLVLKDLMLAMRICGCKKSGRYAN